MSRGEVDVVIVGADRIAANGDVANKIGTYPLAVLAKRHGIPFYVAAPLSTFDLENPRRLADPDRGAPRGRGHRLPRHALGAGRRIGAQPRLRRDARGARHRDHQREGDRLSSLQGKYRCALEVTPLPKFVALYAAIYGAYGVASPFLPAFVSGRGLSPQEIGSRSRRALPRAWSRPRLPAASRTSSRHCG